MLVVHVCPTREPIRRFRRIWMEGKMVKNSFKIIRTTTRSGGLPDRLLGLRTLPCPRLCHGIMRSSSSVLVVVLLFPSVNSVPLREGATRPRLYLGSHRPLKSRLLLFSSGADRRRSGTGGRNHGNWDFRSFCLDSSSLWAVIVRGTTFHVRDTPSLLVRCG